jgi:quercetin dioxygenase-like cupin family protein
MSAPATSLQSFARKADEGEDLWVLGGLYSFLGSSGETGAYLACQVEGPQGFAIPVHLHDDEEEGFYVADGEVTVFLGEEGRRLGRGAFAFAARGTPHAFRLETPDALLLLLVSPGSKHEPMLREMGTLASAHRIPPPPEEAPNAAELGAISARHGTHVVGPPPIG